MKVTLSLVSSGETLDTITVSDEGDLTYDTGAAKPIVRGIKQAMGGEWLKALADWSNGYLALHEASLTAAFRFAPDQPRDREGKWTDGPVGTVGGASAIDEWTTQPTATAGLDDARIMQLGGDIGRVMTRDGTTMADAGAFYDAATEALSGSEVTPRQYATALDERYGTALAERVEAALRQRGDTPAARPAATPEVPDGDALPEPSGPDASETSFPAITVSDSNENWRDIESSWTDGQRKALQTYTSLAYSDINRALWEGRGNRGPYADTIREVRSAMAPSPVSQTVYRRTSGKSFGLPEFASTDELRGLVGTTVQNPGFTSTTVDESVLADHPAVVHMQIEVPRGTPSAWMHNVGLDHDGELLLDANTRYEVLSIDPMGSFETLMRVRIVP